MRATLLSKWCQLHGTSQAAQIMLLHSIIRLSVFPSPCRIYLMDFSVSVQMVGLVFSVLMTLMSAESNHARTEEPAMYVTVHSLLECSYV